MIRFLPEDAVIAMHNHLIQKYGGESGLRDADLLDSALNQAKLLVQFSDTLPSLHLLAATYGFHISENQAFFDGNKRTATAAMIMFLRINGLKMVASDDEIFEKIAAVANRRMDKYQLADWLSSVTAPI